MSAVDLSRLAEAAERKESRKKMNEAPNLLRNWLITCFAGTLGVRASPSWAAAAALPWDQTLIALQNMLVGTVAPAAIGFAFTGAVVLYALGGHHEQAGRLFGSGLGGCIALAIVHLLNYVAL
jgi:hypothetical protein